MSDSTNAFDSFKDNETPKLKSACSECKGYIKTCDNCGQKIEILNGKPLDYHAGSYHRCRGSYR